MSDETKTKMTKFIKNKIASLKASQEADDLKKETISEKKRRIQSQIEELPDMVLRIDSENPDRVYCKCLGFYSLSNPKRHITQSGPHKRYLLELATRAKIDEEDTEDTEDMKKEVRFSMKKEEKDGKDDTKGVVVKSHYRGMKIKSLLDKSNAAREKREAKLRRPIRAYVKKNNYLDENGEEKDLDASEEINTKLNRSITLKQRELLLKWLFSAYNTIKGC